MYTAVKQVLENLETRPLLSDKLTYPIEALSYLPQKFQDWTLKHKCPVLTPAKLKTLPKLICMKAAVKDKQYFNEVKKGLS